MEAEVGVSYHKPRNAWDYQVGKILPKPAEEAQPC